MMDFLKDNWQSVAGTAVALGGLAYIPLARTVLVKGIKVLLSEAFLKEMFVALAEKYVKSTKTSLDDAFLAKLKESL
jgi:hypothetical protein